MHLQYGRVQVLKGRNEPRHQNLSQTATRYSAQRVLNVKTPSRSRHRAWKLLLLLLILHNGIEPQVGNGIACFLHIVCAIKGRLAQGRFLDTRDLLVPINHGTQEVVGSDRLARKTSFKACWFGRFCPMPGTLFRALCFNETGGLVRQEYVVVLGGSTFCRAWCSSTVPWRYVCLFSSVTLTCAWCNSNSNPTNRN